jgi:predicted xylose isomerase-like sugar epimerase
MQTARKKKQRYAVNELTTEQMTRRFNRLVKKELGISAVEFINQYQAGEYEEVDDCDIRSLLMLLPFTAYSSKYGNKQKR